MIYVHQMPDGSESVELLSFPVQIREFVNSVRERDPEKCCPFGSISDRNDLNDQIGQVSLVDQKVPEDSEDHESFEAERRKGNQTERENENSADNERQNQLILSLPDQNVPEDTAAPETSEQQRKRKGKEVAYEDSESAENSAENEIQNPLALYMLERYAPENAQNVEALGIYGGENQSNGKEIVVYENPAERQLVVYNGNHTPAEIDAAPDSDFDTSRTISDLPTESRNIYRRRFRENVNKAAKNKNNREKNKKFPKNQTFRVLSDIFTELKDEIVEIPFPILSRKRKVEKTNFKNKNKNKKKHKAPKTNEALKFDEAEPSNRRAVGSNEPCGSELVVGRVSRVKSSILGLANRKKSREPSGSELVVGRVSRVKSSILGLANRKKSREPSGSELVVGRVSRVKSPTLRLANRKKSCEPCGSGSVVGRCPKAKQTNHEPANRKKSSKPSDSQLAVSRVKRAKPLKQGPKRLKSDIEKEDVLDQAVDGLLCLGKEMLKELKCKGLDECDGCEPPGSRLVEVQAGEVNGSRDEMEMVQTREVGSEDLVCSLNQNPADFSTEIAKRFMRRI